MKSGKNPVMSEKIIYILILILILFMEANKDHKNRLKMVNYKFLPASDDVYTEFMLGC
jgi:hypothetical protein